jgi:transglutaminase-like putative cysteine protease
MRPFALVGLPFVAVAALAQAPNITPSGDPSVKSDTIYRLAVDPKTHPDDPYIFLLDDGVVRVESDGRTVRTYRQVVQILTQDGVEDWAEQSFGYDASREKLRINWIRVVKPDGTVISDGASHEQESLSPVALSAPVYSDGKVRRVSLAGVAPGTIVDYSYTTERFQAPLPGDFSSAWSVHTGRFTRRSRLVVDMPENYHPRIQEQNLRFKTQVTLAKGRRVYVWATQDVPRIEREPFAGSPDTVFSHIQMVGTTTWEDVARWYAGLAKDRFEITPALDAKLAELVAGSKTLEDSLRAVHRWVAQDIRYVSLSLGIGGYQPRQPAAVLDTKYGDCKDKATLFIALARRMGVTAYPLLLSSSADADSTLPSINQFDHMIAAVVWPGRPGYQFLDLTADLVPFGLLPPSEQGGFALVVRPDGSDDHVVLPEAPVADNREVSHITGALSPDGMFSGRLEESATGNRQYGLRDNFRSRPDSTEQKRLARNIANAVFAGAAGDSLSLFDGRDLTIQPRLAVAIHNGRATSSAGGTDIFTLPIRTYQLRGMAADLQSRGERKFPLSAPAVSGEGVDEDNVDITLPEGWHARLPKDVDLPSDWGHYEAHYSQSGRVLKVTRRMTGARGVFPPSRVNDLITWLEAVSADDAKYIVLEHGN